MQPLLLVAWLLATPGAPAARRASPNVVVLFIPASGQPAFALGAAISSIPGEGNERQFAYQAQVSNLPALRSLAAGSSTGSYSHVVDLRFDQAPPLDGWPERAGLGVALRDDGGLEVTLAGPPTLRLRTAPVLLSGVGLSSARVVPASVAVGSVVVPGCAAVELLDGGQPGQLGAPGTLLDRDGAGNCRLTRLDAIAQRRWPADAATPVLASMEILDGDRVAGQLLPRVLRLVEQDRMVLLERPVVELEPAAMASLDGRFALFVVHEDVAGRAVTSVALLATPLRPAP